MAALFGGLLTKIGIYSMWQVLVLVFPNELVFLQPLILALAAFTMITGVLGAIALGEWRRLLSFHIISQMRFSDFYLRTHYAAKAGTLPPALLVLSVILYFADPLLTIKLIVLMLLYFFGTPTGIQVINRGAHVAKTPISPQTWIDELADTDLTDAEQHVQVKDKSSKPTV